MKKEEILGVRIDPKLKEEIGILSKISHTSSSEWVRSRLSHEVQKSIEDMRYQIILEYMRGNITRKELEKIFGDLVDDIDFIIEKVEEDFLKAEKLAEKIG